MEIHKERKISILVSVFLIIFLFFLFKHLLDSIFFKFSGKNMTNILCGIFILFAIIFRWILNIFVIKNLNIHYLGLTSSIEAIGALSFTNFFFLWSLFSNLQTLDEQSEGSKRSYSINFSTKSFGSLSIPSKF